MVRNESTPEKECSRRDFIFFMATASASLAMGGCVASASTKPTEPLVVEATPQSEVLPSLPGEISKAKESLLQLTVGNLRYVSGHLKSPHQTLERREELTSGQSPIAAVLCCSDSRVPPEIIFDQGLGDIFVVRVAGNIAAFSDILASLEYAVEHLEVPLVMVMGHQKCGAITTALQGTTMEGNLGELMKALYPAVEVAKKLPGDQLENTVRANVRLTVKQIIQESGIIAKALEERKIEIIGAYYSLTSGKVELI
jgi:carbonic anhydrase